MTQKPKTEFDAFKEAHDALAELDDEAKERVLKSITTFFGLSGFTQSNQTPGPTEGGEPSLAQGQPATATGAYSSFAELYDATNPSTNGEKALVAGYWCQVCEQADSFTAQAANKELTNLGHRIANVTDAIAYLQRLKPALVLQLKKSGSTRQARKTYKVSVAGINRVKDMIGG